jgi:uncharacterized protein (TIGR02302 family)
MSADFQLTPDETRFRGKLRLAGLALLWERLFPALWPAIATVGVFLALALFDLFRVLPGWLHAGILVVFAGALVWALLRLFRLRPPGIAQARRRLEQASGLLHRPLTSLSDQLVGGGSDPATVALWRLHRERMERETRRLRIGVPAGGLAATDPRGLRAALALVLVVAAFGAGDQWRMRLVRAIHPVFASGPPAPPPSLDIWMTPPDYTGLPPQFLQRDHQDATISVPTGSTLLAQVHGGRHPPQLLVDEAKTDFAPVDAQNFKAQATIAAGHHLTVAQDGGTLAAWPIQVIPDLPPKIAFATPPQKTQRAALRLEYQTSDDYGVESVKAVITRQGGKPDETLTLDLPLPAQHPKEAKASSFHDLTPHIWAGLPVEIRLVATDALGQTGESDPVRMTLPERNFKHPIARAIIEQRKQLVMTPDDRRPVSEILSDLSARPALYREDIVVFLALRSASDRLILDKSATAVPEVEQLLWDTALRVEDGGLSLAQRELRELQRQLQDAISRNAPDAEIEKMIADLKQAIDRYLEQMAQAMQQMTPEQLQNLPPIDPSRMISRDDLQKMLDRAREMARTGAKDAARDLLSQLQEMLENLQAGRMQAENGQAGQAMQQMQKMMRQQQQLLDRSFRNSRQGQQGQQGQRGQQGQQGQRGQQGQQGQQGDGGDAQQQEALRRMLGDMMGQMGEHGGDIPRSMGRAERAMRDAAEALQRNQPGAAVGPQTEALDQLQQAARDMAQQMMNQAGRQGDPNGEPGMRPPGQRVDRDPLGRDRAGMGNFEDEDVKIPGQADVQKSREILDELRRRSGERQRPPVELDYIDRLLKRF